MKQETLSTASAQAPSCTHDEPVLASRSVPDAQAIERAARLFRALGDGPRLRVLHYLAQGEACVSEIVSATAEKFPTVSQRLRVLRAEGLVIRRRKGLHVFYALADRHVAELLANALDHASELNAGAVAPPGAIPPVTQEDD